MPTDTELRNFLETEYQANRNHADHINDHRLSFLKFYAGFVASVLGIAKFFQNLPTPSPGTDHLVLGLLAIGCIFGILTVVIMAHYWAGRDYMRLRNNVAVEEILSDSPDVDRYLKVSKKHMKRMPSVKSMFAFVAAMVILGNQIVMFIFIQQVGLVGGIRTSILLSFPLVQVALVFLYRFIALGRSVELPCYRPITQINETD